MISTFDNMKLEAMHYSYEVIVATFDEKLNLTCPHQAIAMRLRVLLLSLSVWNYSPPSTELLLQTY